MFEQHEIAGLLSRLCIELGYCIPPADAERLEREPPQSASELTDAVFRAEGLESERLDGDTYRSVFDRVAAVYAAAERRERDAEERAWIESLLAERGSSAT